MISILDNKLWKLEKFRFFIKNRVNETHLGLGLFRLLDISTLVIILEKS